MELAAGQLRRLGPSAQVRAAVLVLHGGTDNKKAARKPIRRVPPRPWVNAFRVQEGLVRRLARSGVAVWALRHRLAGWDDERHPTPVSEARAAMAQIAETFPAGDIPVVLVGHSMGGRTAVRIADDPAVIGVIGLAPWFPADERTETLAGKHLSVAYADLDWTCPFGSMETFLGDARRVTASTRTECMGRDFHEMLFERRWHDFTAREVVAMIRRSAASS